MVSFPPCKINLGLHVLRKRADGFHDIETCFYPVPWTDILDIVPAERFSFAISGANVPGPSADNLCVRAFDMIQAEFNTGPVAMHLHKILPIGAGLGGGSSDGAHTLKSLNRIFELGMSDDELKALASRLGSDCAFFIEDAPCIGTGRGEVLQEVSVSLKGKFIVIVKPDVHISTAAAYAAVTPQEPERSVRDIVEKYPIEAWRDLLNNDFEFHLFRQYPQLEAIHQKFYEHGAVFARMTGSGSAVFGIFDRPADLGREFEGFTCWSGYLD